MTRVKKTRSLKRIHKTKTGSKSKLKKQLGTDRQGRKDMRGKRVLSAYEKFLLENPEAKEKAVAEQVAKQRQSENKTEEPAKAEETQTKAKTAKERSTDLFDQLESKNIKDVF